MLGGCKCWNGSSPLIAGKLAVEASGNLNSYGSPEDKWLAAGNKRLRLP